MIITEDWAELNQYLESMGYIPRAGTREGRRYSASSHSSKALRGWGK